MNALISFFLILFGNHIAITERVQHPNLSLSDARSILGEPTILFNHQDSTGPDAYFQSRSTYKATDQGITPDKERFLYYSFEQYPSVAIANKLIDSYMQSNQDHQGYEVLNGIGEEGFYHTDNQNFCTFVARKGKYMIRMKVNKLSPKANLETFRQIGIKLTKELH